MLGSFWVAAQLAASQEGPNSMSEWVSRQFCLFFQIKEVHYEANSAYAANEVTKEIKEEDERNEYDWETVSFLLPSSKEDVCIFSMQICPSLAHPTPHRHLTQLS
jgi:hypothetical protein